MTFDRLDTDGCMSTNDTVLLMASGASGRAGPTTGEFAWRSPRCCADLARQLQLDAEGASKMITIEVVGAASEDDAVTVGRAVARNNLLKCAIGGVGPQLGPGAGRGRHHRRRLRPRPAQRRDQRRLGLPPRRGGGRARPRLTSGAEDVTITVDLSAGSNSAMILTTDLTEAYVHENSAYSS